MYLYLYYLLSPPFKDVRQNIDEILKRGENLESVGRKAWCGVSGFGLNLGA